MKFSLRVLSNRARGVKYTKALSYEFITQVLRMTHQTQINRSNFSLFLTVTE